MRNPSVTVRLSTTPFSDDWFVAEHAPGQTLRAMLGDAPIAAWVDGVPLADATIERARWKAGVVIDVRPMPEDGSVLRMVGMLALAIAAPAVGAAAAGAFSASGVVGGALLNGAAYGLTATAASAIGALAGAGVLVGGGMLLNALIPPKVPSSPDAPSQQFSLTGAANQVGAFVPIPRLYGRMRFFPVIPMTARPYTETVGSDQYFRMFLVLSTGRLSVGGVMVGGPSDGVITQGTALSESEAPIKIGDTDIHQYANVQFQIGRPDQITLFTSDIEETQVGWVTDAAGQNGDPDDGDADGRSFVQTTDIDTDAISFDFAGVLYCYSDSKGKARQGAVAFRVQYRLTGTSAWTDIAQLQGPTHVGDDTISGFTFVVQHSGMDPIRFGKQYPLPARGQYDIRITRVITVYTGAGNRGAQLTWTVLRSIHNKRPFVVKNTVCMGLRIKATDQINGSVQNLSVLATSVLPVYNGSAWVEQATRNHAWVAVDVLCGNANQMPMQRSEIDAAGFWAWASDIDARGAHYDAVWSDSATLFQRLENVCGAGRATRNVSPDGTIGVIMDRAQSVPRMIITPRNSYSYTYTLNAYDPPDALRVRYTDPRTWQPTDRIVYADGYDESTAQAYQTLEADGCTDAEQAWLYGRYHLACMRLRDLETHTFSQDIQHWRYQRGDLLELAHDVIEVGLAYARIKGINGNVITLDDSVTMNDAQSYGVRIQHFDGSMATVGVVYQQATTNTITLAQSDAQAEPDCLVVFGVLGQLTQDVIVTRIAPSGDGQATITCQNAAWAVLNPGPVPPPDTRITAPQSPIVPAPPVPIITSVVADETALVRGPDGTIIDGVRIAYLALDAGGAQAQFRMDAGNWSHTYSQDGVSGTILMFPVEEDALLEVRVRAVRDGVTSEWTTRAGVLVTGKSSPPEQVTGLAARVDGRNVRVSWQRNVELDVIAYEVRDSDAGWGGQGALFIGDTLSAAVSPPAAGTEKTYYVRAIDVGGRYSETSGTVVFAADPVPEVENVTHSFFDTSETSATITLHWTGVTPQFGIAGYQVSYTDGALREQRVDATSVILPANWIGTRAFTILVIDQNGNISAGRVEAVEKLLPDPPTNLKANVIDNNVMLYWTLPEPTTLPVSHIHIKQGVDWSSAEEIGTKKGSFDALTETTPGKKTYWLRTVDTDGWESDAVSLTANVDQPPDFKLNGDQFSHFTGSLQNAVVAGGRVLARDLSFVSTQRETAAGEIVATQPGDVWYVHGSVNNVNSTYTVYIGIMFTGPAGEILVPGTSLPAGQSAELEAFITAPLGVTTAQFGVLMDMPEGTAGQEATWSGVYAVSRQNAQLVMPVNTEETWEEHFASRNWASIQDQVGAGYPIYAQPSVNFAQYQEVFDFAQVFASSRVDLILNEAFVAGTATVLVELETSADGQTWEAKQQARQIFGTNFRFVRVTIKCLQDADDHAVYLIQSIECKLSTKLRNDGGSVDCDANAPNGTLANFNFEFVDVQSITVSAQGTTPGIPMYDYKDAILDGTYSILDGVVTANVLNHSQTVGQNVRLGYANGAPEIVTVTEVVSPSVFKAVSVNSNKSGGVRMYSEGARYYRFDPATGARQSGVVSWSIKGN